MRKGRPLLPQEMELFQKALGIGPHNFWRWSSRTRNFKLLTDGEYVWVEGSEEDIGKPKPLNEATWWSWEFIREKLKELS
ncbi:hypothetical protein [Thermocrinis minervae]|uniref:Uncharacterized protein n=1 Tax=Thermocrinis minervae TaxID=381751 RepID=A0A1M6QNA8_9AQUI|nr:hypothetical protein [Thermocrinis minervae]SHK21741.1 hypothetical protein SAMN05444391_0310 [Thermocrinis minervae]